tara:strand:+ start:5427 stop:5654 length:228 start_codon:yes stop_codon:yes gene_type:complete
MKNIETHINKDKQELEDPNISPQRRRHIECELHELEEYVQNHRKEIEDGDHHDPSPLELFCDSNPEADECRIYED